MHRPNLQMAAGVVPDERHQQVAREHLSVVRMAGKIQVCARRSEFFQLFTAGDR